MADPTIVLVHGAFADASGFRGFFALFRGISEIVIAFGLRRAQHP